MGTAAGSSMRSSSIEVLLGPSERAVVDVLAEQPGGELTLAAPDRPIGHTGSPMCSVSERAGRAIRGGARFPARCEPPQSCRPNGSSWIAG